jgi:lysozyme family protein
MAYFAKAFQLVIANEGGYGNDPDDPGGETYKGIARKKQSDWDGWKMIDLFKVHASFPSVLYSNIELQNKVESFYKLNFWNPIFGDDIEDQNVANSIFDFAVNAGTHVSEELAQIVVKTPVDGTIGKQTLAAINSIDPEKFLAMFKVEKIERYISICNKRPESRKYFFGWVQRAINV